MRRIGIDTGGTFTDCVLIDDASESMVVAKVPSQPKNPEKAILNGVLKLLEQSGDAPDRIDSVSHGTTIATNVVITGNYARAGLIATRGCRDVLEIGSQQRPKLYDLHQRQAPPLITRDLRIEVPGRIAADGSEVEPVDREAIRAAARQLIDAGVEAIAVAGLFAFANPAHERAIAEVLKEEAPDLHVACSAQISPEVREYPRFATTAVNATLGPLLNPYIGKLEAMLGAEGFDCPLYIMQSNGGVGTAARSVGEKAHQLVLSGPAGGVIGGIFAAEPSGYGNLVTLDVGGTSADIGVVVAGRPRVRLDMPLPNGIPLHLLNLEIETIGAGGGSIAWVDPGGALQVGPMSAGADPGPACYGIGGTRPTVTDAQVFLRRLNPKGLLGGDLKVDRDAAAAAIRTIAEPLGLTVEKAALGIVAVMEANMAGAIRQSAARHGDDLREFALVAAGGAGALDAVALAKALGIPKVLVPPRPGLLSAIGLLAANLRHDLAQPLLMSAETPDAAAIQRAEAELVARAMELLSADGAGEGRRRCDLGLDLRYVGQEYSVTVPTGRGEPLAAAIERFHGLHERTYGHSSPGDAVELVAVRVVGWGLFEAPRVRPEPATKAAPESRAVWFEEAGGYVPTAIHARQSLAPGRVMTGPAIIEQLDTTTVLPPGWRATVDKANNIVIEEAGA